MKWEKLWILSKGSDFDINKINKRKLRIQRTDYWHAQGVEKYNDTYDVNRSPEVIFKNDYDDFDYYLDNLEAKEPKDGLVPHSTFFCLDERRNIIVGAVNIRHYLNEHLLLHGGHIGDGIRPSERRKGYAVQMIGLALEECKNGNQKVLMVCDKDNIGSAKSIIKNGGILENEQIENGKTEQRYWIDLE